MIVTFDSTVEVVAAEAEPRRSARSAASRCRGTQVGTVADGTRVRFAPGSLDAAARPIVTLGHDGRAIGRTVDEHGDRQPAWTPPSRCRGSVTATTP